MIYFKSKEHDYKDPKVLALQAIERRMLELEYDERLGSLDFFSRSKHSNAIIGIIAHFVHFEKL